MNKFTMSNTYQPPSIDISDIESRLIILKRRAAEANFLREERDMLLNRLKLFTNDYVWPQRENDSAEVNVEEALYQKFKEENERLLQENEILNEAVISLKKEINDMEKMQEELIYIKEENETLKNALTKLPSLEEEVQSLLKEKQEVTGDLESLLQLINSDEPSEKCKNQIKQIFCRANELKKERENLREMLFEKDLKIDILLGKISHLESRLNEKLISAKLKVKLGEHLDVDEELLWTVQKLETANKSMSQNLSELTDQFNLMNEKYNKLLAKVNTENVKSHDVSSKHKLLLSSSRETYEQRILSSKSFQELENFINEWDTDWIMDDERGSTGPPTPRFSDESLYERHSNMERESNLASMRSINKAVRRCHLKLTQMKKKMDEEERQLLPSYKHFYAPVQVEDPLKGSFRMIGSIVFFQESPNTSKEGPINVF